jgi:hypothetical protein
MLAMRPELKDAASDTIERYDTNYDTKRRPESEEYAASS